VGGERVLLLRGRYAVIRWLVSVIGRLAIVALSLLGLFVLFFMVRDDVNFYREAKRVPAVVIGTSVGRRTCEMSVVFKADNRTYVLSRDGVPDELKNDKNVVYYPKRVGKKLSACSGNEKNIMVAYKDHPEEAQYMGPFFLLLPIGGFLFFVPICLGGIAVGISSNARKRINDWAER
jgi:hypothetical protein